MSSLHILSTCVGSNRNNDVWDAQIKGHFRVIPGNTRSLIKHLKNVSSDRLGSLKPISTSKSPEVGNKSRPVLLYIKVGKEDDRRVRGQED